MPQIDQHEARDLARAYLRKKTWAGQYLHGAKDIIDVVDRQSTWQVVFRHARWRSEKPGKGTVIINKSTGAAAWKTPKTSSQLH